MHLMVRLLMAHLLTDFVFQPTTWVEGKRQKGIKSKFFWYHIILTTIVAGIMTWDAHIWFVPIVIGGTHLLIDWWKLTKEEDNLFYYSIDQLAHILVIVSLSSVCTPDVWQKLISGWNSLVTIEHLWVLIAYLLVVYPAGYFISYATQYWRNDLNTRSDEPYKTSLDRGGIWIGRLERLLVLTFILLGEWGAIGFLIAAKSILRFADRPEQRKQSEYVLIGTLLSFCIAIGIGLLVTTTLFE